MFHLAKLTADQLDGFAWAVNHVEWNPTETLILGYDEHDQSLKWKLEKCIHLCATWSPPVKTEERR